MDPEDAGLPAPDQIEKLKSVGLEALGNKVKMRVIDTLAAYGVDAIPAITEIVDRSLGDDVKEHGLDTIKLLKSPKTTGADRK